MRQVGAVERRRHLAERAVVAHRRRPAGDGRRIEQMLDRHIDERRIAEVILAVGHRQVHAFGDAMQVGGRIVRQIGDADPLQQRQRLEQRRPLAPRAAGDHLVAAPGPPHHRLDRERYSARSSIER